MRLGRCHAFVADIYADLCKEINTYEYVDCFHFRRSLGTSMRNFSPIWCLACRAGFL